VVGCWRGYLSGARCRLVYGPTDATATHFSKIQVGLIFLVPDHPGSPGKGPLNGCVCVCVCVCVSTSAHRKDCLFFDCDPIVVGYMSPKCCLRGRIWTHLRHGSLGQCAPRSVPLMLTRPQVSRQATNPRATATCCHSTASARQRTPDESIFTKLSSTRNLFNNGEQSLNCYSVTGNHG